MILVTMLIILTATLVIVIIGFVMDRMAIRKIQGGMRKMYKQSKDLKEWIETLEKQVNPYNISLCSEKVAKGARDYISKTSIEEEVTYEAVEVDTDTDKEAQAKDSGALPDSTDDDI